MASLARPNPLAALGAHLGAHGFAVELTDRGLKVSNPQVAGCCPEVAHASDTITCRSRQEDGGRLWFSARGASRWPRRTASPTR
nr:hypothetical protein GCM10010200_047860 [Actinomadura rugatobispora]